MKLYIKRLIFYLMLLIFIILAIIYRNIYKYSYGFMNPYEFTIIQCNTNLIDIESKKFSNEELLLYPTISDKEKILEITTLLNNLSVKKINPYKDLKLLDESNIIYFIKFSTSLKSSLSGNPTLESIFVFDNKDLLIKINSHNKSYYFKGYLDNFQYKTINSIQKT